MLVSQALRDATKTLEDAKIDTARLDAEVLLAQCLATDRLTLLCDTDRLLELRVLTHFQDLLARRCTHEPIAYIIGRAEFYSLSFKVTPDVLIPRADSEILVEQALKYLQPEERAHVADLGSGSGCLAIALSAHRPNLKIDLVDVCSAALDVAVRNAADHAVEQCVRPCHLPLKDYLDTARDLDGIISNPPYISETEMAELPRTVSAFEPEMALKAQRDGLIHYQDIAKRAQAALKPRGFVCLEHGHTQARAVSELFDASIWEREMFRDLAGRDRVFCARLR